MPIALLVVIIAGGLATTVVATTITGQRSVRFDRDYTEVVHTADSGVQQALVQLNDTGSLPTSTPVPVQPVDGVTPVVTATQHGPMEWEIRGEATMNGVERAVVVETYEIPLFTHALYARDGISFNGANLADSYNPSTGDWCTGNGLVGTDIVFAFSGRAPANSCHDANRDITVDQAILYDCGSMTTLACAASILPAGARCVHTGGDNCTEPTLEARTDPFRLTPESELARIADDTATCEADGWDDTHPARAPSASSGGVASSANGVWVTGDDDIIQAADPATHSDGRGFWCVTSLRFGGDTTVQPGAGGEPVRIYVKEGSITTDGTGTEVNCPGCGSGHYMDHLPTAADLQIVGVGASSFSLASPQIKFAGAVYVPNGACSGPAGADIYGSVICGIVANVGNWAFHYDDRLSEAGGTGLYGIDRYREEQT